MKKSILITSLFFLFQLGLQAQIIEKESNMSLGVQMGNEMLLEDVPVNDADDLWEDYLEDRYDTSVKRNRRADEYYATGVRINSIFSVSNIDLYATFTERGNSTVMILWVDLGMAFVNSKDYQTEYQGVVNLMNDFRIQARTHAVNEEFENAEEDLEDLKDDLDKLQRDNERLHEKIKDYEEKIVEAEHDIEQNLIEQQNARVTIDKQIQVLKQIQLRLESIKKQAY